MAIKKVYVAGTGPYLHDTDDLVDDADGDWSGEYDVALRTDDQVVATEFLGIPISSVSVANIDDPSSELNLLSASTIGGLVSVFQPQVGADDEFTMYLWDTDAATENVPYTVDGDGGVWIAVAGKYRNGDVYVGGDINFSGEISQTMFNSIVCHDDQVVCHENQVVANQ